MVPGAVVGPLRNALQKLAGGIDFFALEPEERDSLDHTIRHLWNPGDDQEQTRERTVPIEVVALAMRDRVSGQRSGELPSPPTKPAAAPRSRSRTGQKKDSRPTQKLNRLDHPASGSGSIAGSGAPSTRDRLRSSRLYAARTTLSSASGTIHSTRASDQSVAATNTARSRASVRPTDARRTTYIAAI